MKKLIIFDMDGVIVQTHQTSGAVMQEVVRDLFKIEITDEDLKKFYGISDYEFYSEIIVRTHSNILIDKVLEEQFFRYNHKLRNVVEATEGVISVIKELSKSYLVAICSGSTREQVDVVMEKFGIVNEIKMSISCNDVHYGKPNPEGYLKILETLNVSANETLAIEDTPVGIEAALAAEIEVVGFDNKLQQDLSMATYYCNDMKEIINFIK